MPDFFMLANPANPYSIRLSDDSPIYYTHLICRRPMNGIPQNPWQAVHMGITAENVAARSGFSREIQDALALQSQQRAAAPPAHYNGSKLREYGGGRHGCAMHPRARPTQTRQIECPNTAIVPSVVVVGATDRCSANAAVGYKKVWRPIWIPYRS
jgi:hypothetical protein